MITLASIPRKSDRFCVREIGGETIFLSPDGREIHAVNELGTFIWSLLDGQATLSQVRDRICDEYDVPPVQCSCDLIDFVTELAERNLLTIAP